MGEHQRRAEISVRAASALPLNARIWLADARQQIRSPMLCQLSTMEEGLMTVAT